MAAKFYSPLRYPGGKGKLANFIKLIFEKNNLEGGVYVEPYAGGSSVALALLLEGYASSIIINDFDRSIYAFWHSVLYETDELCRLISDTEITMDVHNHQVEIQRQKETAELLELGFSTFFLNRTNRSGIIKAGVIGGNDQTGNYLMNVRFNKVDLVTRIRNIAAKREDISLYNLDAIDLIREISDTLPRNTLIYFDPPYYLKGKELYVNYYQHEDHLLVSRMIRGIRRHRWLVSYDNRPEIKELYRGKKKITYSLNYSAGNANTGTEVMIYHTRLIVPRADRPTLVR